MNPIRNNLRCSKHFLLLFSLCAPALLLEARGDDKSSTSPVITGTAAQSDWQQDAPGVRRHITVADLPRPFDTKSVNNGPHVVRRPADAQLKVPAGFKIELYAEGLNNPRFLLTAPNGDLFVTESGPGDIRLLRDTTGKGKPDMNVVFASGLKQPFGVAFYPPGPNPKFIYVANTDSVVRFPYTNGDSHIEGEPERITELSGGGHLTGGGHWTRNVVFSKDGKKMFVSIGSKSNVDESHSSIEDDRARVFELNPDGTDRKVYASGIRNAVGIGVHPETGEVWVSTNERDALGDNLVPDYITHLKEDGFYGWPWYYMGAHQDPRQAGQHPELAGKVLVPDVLVASHSASLNLIFYTGNQFPASYHNDIFAAFHGSWNRSSRTGYKIIHVPLKHGVSNGVYEDFVTGFVNPDGTVWGRPVGLTVAKDGALLFSEDGGNTIWRVSHQ